MQFFSVLEDDMKHVGKDPYLKNVDVTSILPFPESTPKLESERASNLEIEPALRSSAALAK